MKKILLYLTAISIFWILTMGSLAAQDFSEFPQNGLLAANGSLPSGNLALPQLPMGMNGKKVPFVAGLSKSKENKWEYSVTNNTDKRLKIDLEIAQYSQNTSAHRESDIKKISSSNIQFRIKPAGSDRGKAAVSNKSIGAALILRSWSLE